MFKLDLKQSMASFLSCSTSAETAEDKLASLTFSLPPALSGTGHKAALFLSPSFFPSVPERSNQDLNLPAAAFLLSCSLKVPQSPRL